MGFLVSIYEVPSCPSYITCFIFLMSLILVTTYELNSIIIPIQQKKQIGLKRWSKLSEKTQIVTDTTVIWM